MNPNLGLFAQMARPIPAPAAPAPAPMAGAMGSGPSPLPAPRGGVMPPQAPVAMGGPAAQRRFTPQEMLALQGRFGDRIVAHLEPGEIQVPPEVQNKKVLATLRKAFHKAGVNQAQFTAGSPVASRNPKTGLPEYNFLGNALGMLGGLAGGAYGGPQGAVAGSALGMMAGGPTQASYGPMNESQLPLPPSFTSNLTPVNQLPPYNQLLGMNSYSGPQATFPQMDYTKYGFGPGVNFFPQGSVPAPAPAPAPAPVQQASLPGISQAQMQALTNAVNSGQLAWNGRGYADPTNPFAMNPSSNANP